MLVEWVLGSGGLNVSVRSACHQRTSKDDGGALVLWAVGGCVTDDSCTCSRGTGGGLDALVAKALRHTLGSLRSSEWLTSGSGVYVCVSRGQATIQQRRTRRRVVVNEAT